MTKNSADREATAVAARIEANVEAHKGSYGTLPGKSQEPLSPVGVALGAPRSCVHWFQKLQYNFGTELLVAIFAAEHLIKGFDHGVGMDATGFLWKAYHVEASNVQTYVAIKAMPWSLKPVFGAISDLLPIMGYRKAPYIVISSIIGVCCYLAIGLDFATTIPVQMCVVMLIGCNLQGSVCDLLTEAQYSERLAEQPEHGPDLVSFVWLGQTVLSLVASLVIGPLLSVGGPHLVFLICVGPASVVFWPMMRNYFGERYQTPKEASDMRARMLAVWEVFIPVCAVLFGAIALTFTGLAVHSKLLRLIVALVCLAVVLVAIYISLRPEISRVISFYIIQSAVHVSFSGASFYFYTDTADEFAAGPHFSKTFFTTVLGVVSAICSLIGLWLYVSFFKHWGYRKLLYVTNVILCVAYLLDIVQFTRFNKTLGISDHVFVLGSHTVQRVVARVAWMPQVLMLSQMCPRGLEGTMYAILAGSANFGSSISSFLGAYLLQVCGVNPKGNVGDAAHFANLWLPCAVSAVLPALMILIIPLMIPDIHQTGAILVEDPSSPSAGSLINRWTTRRRATALWSTVDTNLG
mmetsp:Transcript_21578/g.50304  ORF Transcript_21578/g.50304 Transcript_21578/m.50304 type:complete len:578 (-) Transcript_21578:89-1822(-)